MRKLFTLFFVLTGTVVLSGLVISCEGPSGPPGPPGPVGPAGADGLIGSVFEAQIDFNKGNDYQELVEFPTNIEVFDSDVIVAYILTAVDNGTDIWEPLPQTLFFGDDILLYGYDHTSTDIRFFLDGTVVLDNLDPFYTEGIVFRVAILPADFAKTIDLNKFEDVMRAIEFSEVQKIN